MKASIFAVLVLGSFATTGLAAPVYETDSQGTVGTRGFQTVDSAYASMRDPIHILATRQQLPSDTNSSLSGIPIIGPFLKPLEVVLQHAQLAGPSSPNIADVSSVTAEQLAQLAALEAILAQAIFNLTTQIGSPIVTPAALFDSTASDSASDGLTLETRGLLDLGSILAGLPIIGPFLKPLLPLLDSIGLGASSIAAVGDVKSITLDQASILAQLELNLAQAVISLYTPSSDTTPLSSVLPAVPT